MAETFLSLTQFKENEEKVFRAPIQLLQIWFFFHISRFGIHMNISDISETNHPIQTFKNQDQTSNLSFLEWVNLLKNPKNSLFLKDEIN